MFGVKFSGSNQICPMFSMLLSLYKVAPCTKSETDPAGKK